MALEIEINKTCDTCGGDGVVSLHNYGVSENVECWQCEGSGKLVVLTVNLDDIDLKLNDILDKCNDIFEQVSE